MALLLHGDSYVDQDLFYTTGFLAETVTYVSTGEDEALLVSEMERGRAEDESRVSRVVSAEDLDYREKAREHGRREAYARVVTELLDDLDIEALRAPPRLPAHLYARLSETRSVSLDDDILVDERREKSRREADAVGRAVAAAEAAISRVEEMVRTADADGDHLALDGSPLTSERLRREIEHVLVDHDCVSDDVIAASGPGSHRPHFRGSGPVLTDAPLVLDVFPRRREERYCGDVTRTLVIGEDPEAEAMKEAVVAALRAAEAAADPGAACSEVHRAAAEALEARGYETESDEGFVHSLGHGVGLDVHEEPRLSESSDQELRVGDVFTLEPGLYYEDVGGVRVEDTVLMTETGPERFTELPRDL